MRKVELSVVIFLWAIAVAISATLVVGGMKQIDKTIRSQPICFPPYIQKRDIRSCVPSTPTVRESPRDRRQTENLRPPQEGEP